MPFCFLEALAQNRLVRMLSHIEADFTGKKEFLRSFLSSKLLKEKVAALRAILGLGFHCPALKSMIVIMTHAVQP